MSEEEIRQLESAHKQSETLIHFKSFTSTSKNYDVAKCFRDSKYNPENPNRALVLFEIVLDPSLTCRPFAEISEHSVYQAEEEVLIDIGAVFHVDKMEKEEGISVRCV